MSNEATDKMHAGADAFTKMWSEFASKMATAGFAFKPDAVPPEAGAQVRDAVFRAMEQYWIDFLRSPQFLETMKQTMDGVIAFRKQCNDLLTRAHHEMQGAAREDIDAVMLCVRHLETRLLDRLEAISARVEEIGEQVSSLNGHKEKAPSPPPGPRETVAETDEEDESPRKPQFERSRKKGPKK